MCSWAHLSGWPIRLFFRAKMPFDMCLGWSWTKAHFITRRRFDSRQFPQHADGLVFKDIREVTHFENFMKLHSQNCLYFAFKIPDICVTTSSDSYLCQGFIENFLRMVGTRSGISTTGSEKKEKSKMKKKNVGRKGTKTESNRHGVRIRGMQPSKRAMGSPKVQLLSRLFPPPNPSFTAVREAMMEKTTLSITDITGNVSSNSSSKERGEANIAIMEEAHTSVSPLESPHKMVQGTLILLFFLIMLKRTLGTMNFWSLSLMEQEPPHDDVIGGIMGLGQDVVKDVPTYSAPVHEERIEKR